MAWSGSHQRPDRALPPVTLLVPADRIRSRHGLAPNPGDDIEAIVIGQPEIEQHQVRRLAPTRSALACRPRLAHGIASRPTMSRRVRRSRSSSIRSKRAPSTGAVMTQPGSSRRACRCSRWQIHDDRQAAQVRSLRGDRPAHRLDQPTNDREADPAPAPRASRGRDRTVELVEDPIERPVGNAWSAILDDQAYRPVRSRVSAPTRIGASSGCTCGRCRAGSRLRRRGRPRRPVRRQVERDVHPQIATGQRAAHPVDRVGHGIVEQDGWRSGRSSPASIRLMSSVGDNRSRCTACRSIDAATGAWSSSPASARLRRQRGSWRSASAGHGIRSRAKHS